MTVPALDPFVEFIRSTRMSQVFRNEVAWLWPLCESLHFLGLILLIGAAGFFDLRLMGFMKGVSLRSAKKFVPWAMMGFAVNLLTGLIFFISQPQQYATNLAMWLKVVFLLVAGINAMLFETSFSDRLMALDAGADTPMSAKVIGAVSLMSWFAVLYFGRMLPYLDPNPRSGV
ncbi:MAG TPA: hypothetical protein VL693_15970 [Vicinamibacterales bacterium]|jgi:hypothetical protein|nr:hypothetical protein [Vicinamibacterales bacterium]